MDIEVGSEIEIKPVRNLPAQTVTVVGIRLWIDGESIKSIIAIDGGDGVSTVGGVQLARWVENAAKEYR